MSSLTTKLLTSTRDSRLQGRKADLVAKILARTEGSHEIVGGAGAGKASDTAAATVSTATGKADDGAMRSDSRGDGDSAEEKALAGGTEERGTDAGIGGGRALGGKKTLAADRISARDSGLAGQGDNTDHAPREGSELRGALNPSSNTAASTGAPAEVARTTHGKKAKNPAAPKNKNGGEKGGAARPRRPSKTADAAAARRIRRRLEKAAARAAAVSLPTAAEQGSQGREKAGERQKGLEEAAKEVWDVLSSLPSGGGGGDGSIGGLSLDKLFGDGITAESLVGVARGLRYACGTDVSAEEAQGRGGGALSNTDRASQVRASVVRERGRTSKRERYTGLLVCARCLFTVYWGCEGGVDLVIVADFSLFPPLGRQTRKRFFVFPLNHAVIASFTQPATPNTLASLLLHRKNASPTAVPGARCREADWLGVCHVLAERQAGSDRRLGVRASSPSRSKRRWTRGSRGRRDEGGWGAGRGGCSAVAGVGSRYFSAWTAAVKRSAHLDGHWECTCSDKKKERN